MVMQNALKIKCWADVLGFEGGMTTEGSCSLFLYYDHAKIITRNSSYSICCFGPLVYLDPIYPIYFHNIQP